MGLDFVRQHSGSGDDDENLSNLASSRLALEAHAETGYGHSRRPRQRDSQRFGQEETARIVCKYLVIPYRDRRTKTGWSRRYFNLAKIKILK